MADPFVAMNSIQAANQHESLHLFVEYGYDFDKQCFRYDEKGQNLMVTEMKPSRSGFIKHFSPNGTGT